jgi:hypothetical protein
MMRKWLLLERERKLIGYIRNGWLLQRGRKEGNMALRPDLNAHMKNTALL